VLIRPAIRLNPPLIKLASPHPSPANFTSTQSLDITANDSEQTPPRNNMMSYISPSSSACPSPRGCVSPSPLAHKLNVIGSPLALSPHGSPSFRGIVHPVTPPPFTLASDKPSTTVKPVGPGATLGRQYSTFGTTSASSGGLYGSFDYESEGSNYPAKRMTDVHEALKELHEILMGDVASSESSSDSEEAGEGAFEMDEEDEDEGDEARDEVRTAFPPPSVGIRSGRRASLVAEQKPREKPSKGWRKGVARESVRFQLMVDVPCWEPGCYSGKSLCLPCVDATRLTFYDATSLQTSRPCKRFATRRSRRCTT